MNIKKKAAALPALALAVLTAFAAAVTLSCDQSTDPAVVYRAGFFGTPKIIPLVEGEYHTILSPEDAGVSAQGKTFSAWKDGDGTLYHPGENRIFEKRTILTARWEEEGRASALYVDGSARYGLVYRGGNYKIPLLQVKGIPFDFQVASEVGGVMFTETAKASGGAGEQPVSLDYDSSREDGQRLKVTVGDKTVYPALYDWQLAPVAKYADSQYTAAMSLLNSDLNENEMAFFQKNLVSDGNGKPHSDYMWAVYHPAFQDTLVGLNLFFVDAMLVDTNPAYMRKITTNFSAEIPGYDNILFDEEASSGGAVELALLVETGRLTSPWDSYIYTDYGREITWTVGENDINFEGGPNYNFFKLDNITETVIQSEKLNESINEFPELLAYVNPAIYTAAEKTAQWAAFFRMVKADNPAGWQRFMARMNSVKVPKVDTPRTWKRGRDMFDYLEGEALEEYTQGMQGVALLEMLQSYAASSPFDEAEAERRGTGTDVLSQEEIGELLDLLGNPGAGEDGEDSGEDSDDFTWDLEDLM